MKFSRRKIVLIFSIALITGALSFKYVSAATFGSLDKGLVGHWTLDDANVAGTSVKDVSAYHNHGISTGSPTSQLGAPGMKQSRAFSSGKYVTIPDKGWLNFVNKPLTVSLWMYQTSSIPSGASDYRRLYDKTQAGTGNGYGFDVDGSLLRLLPSGVSVSFVHGLNTWYHIVVTTADSVNATIYINGISQGSIGLSNNAVWLGPAHIACDSDGNSAFPGRIDDVRVYNRMLSASEAKRLMTAGVARVGASTVGKGGSLASGLVGHWTFDGSDTTATTVSDKSVSGNNGTRTGAVSVIAGKLGQGMKFPGGTEKITVANGSYLNTSNFSVSWWNYLPHPKVDTGYKGFPVISKYSYLTDGLGISVGEGGHNGYINCMEIWMDNPGNVNSHNICVAIGSTTPYDKWNHYVIAGSYNGSTTTTLNIYINGQLKGTQDFGGALTANSNSLMVGSSFSGGALGSWFDVKLDDLRLYSRTLSPSEIKQLYAMGSGTVANAPALTTKSYVTGGLKTGLVGHWTFDGMDITAATASDKSGAGNNGTRTGGTSVSAGRLGQALKFNGVNGKITATGYETATFTLSAWVKTSDATDDKWFVEMTDSSGNRHGIGMYPAGYPVITYGVIKWKNATGSVINDSKWHHFVGTSDGTNAKIYIDGVSKSLSAENTTGTKTPSTLTIGSTSTGDYVNSLIDDVRVYSRALSAAEIQQLYQMGK